MGNELRECPLCGSEATEGRNFVRYSVMCIECGISIQSEEVCGEGTVKERWNHRPTEARLRDALEEIRISISNMRYGQWPERVLNEFERLEKKAKEALEGEDES